MKRISRKYVEFLRRPQVARLLLVAFASRMPIGMVGFSMLMFLREALGNFTLAGLAVGVNFVSMAIAAPIQGRIIDRHVGYDDSDLLWKKVWLGHSSGRVKTLALRIISERESEI